MRVSPRLTSSTVAVLLGAATFCATSVTPAQARLATNETGTPAAQVGVATASRLTLHPAATRSGRPESLSAMNKVLHDDLVKTSHKGSVLVYDSTTGKTLYAYDANVPRLPASVQKLYTTSAVLLKFGPNAKLQTRVFGVGTLSPYGTFTGTLYLRGGGDPTFDSAAYNAYNNEGGYGSNIADLANSLRAAGIVQFDGSIVGDGSYFDSLGGGPDTDFKADTETMGIIGALIYNAGFTTVTGWTFQPDPVRYAANALAQAMRAAGIEVPTTTKIAFGVTPKTAKLIATLDSPDMATLAFLTNAPSDDYFAEMLLKGLGAKYGRGGTTNDGVKVVRALIKRRFGLSPRMNDGSGLSRWDRTTAAQVVSLLRQMRSNRGFYDSLAVAGVSGTMADGMLHTRGANNCRGKTGTLHDVANLVGYCTARNGHRLIFAFLMNGLPYDATHAHQIEFKMGVALADYDG